MSATINPRSLGGFFLAAADEHSERPALEVDGDAYTYADLKERALRVAATVQVACPELEPRLCAVLGQRSLGAFAGVLGTALAGHGYVPILSSYPPARVVELLGRAMCSVLLVDKGSLRHVPAILVEAPRPLTIVLLDVPVDEQLRADAGAHTLIGCDELAAADAWSAPAVHDDAIAYILFTSGSTGRPKGVMVAQRNIARFLDLVIERYELDAEDRFTHLFEPTFDLSLFDMFAAWRVGACLCCPGMRERMLPAKYVVDSKLTVWFSVPSTALLMKETRTLVADALPNLRLALFCGEALPVSVAAAFAEAAPNALVENIYGPTELTLACTWYRFGVHTAREAFAEVVPIGEPFTGMRVKLVDAELNDVAVGEDGELLMAGPQVTLGYWQDEATTAKSFVVPPGETEVFYRTGDRVRRPAPGAPLVFLGRMDSQIKVRGYRVELGEIEAVLRAEAGVDAAVALGWPLGAGGVAEGIVAFVAQPGIDTDALVDRLGERLPRYMVPREVHVLDEFPLNANGKIDRKALRASLE